MFLQSIAAYEKDLTAKLVQEASAKRLISMVHQGSFAVDGERQVLRIVQEIWVDALVRGLAPPHTTINRVIVRWVSSRVLVRLVGSTPSRLAMLANSSGGGIGNIQPAPNSYTCSSVRLLSSGGNFSIRLPPSGSGAVSRYTSSEMRSGLRSAAPVSRPFIHSVLPSG
jgi:hypothetical protein